MPGWAAAHDVTASTQPAQWPVVWTFEPWVVVCLALSIGLYALGLCKLWRRAGVGHGVSRGQAWGFAVGWLSLVVALVSPLDALGSQLFSAHMLQHELMMVLVAPLMVVGRPLAVWTWALPATWRPAVGGAFARPAWRGVWRGISAPLSAWVLHAVVLWGWHVPSLFDAALQSNAVHTLQHLSFLFSALLYWWAVLRPAARPAQGAAMLSLFTTMVHTAALGALLTLSPVPWYAHHIATAQALGIDPLEDQQLGGLVMWVPAGFAYFGCGLALAWRWVKPGPRPRPATTGAGRTSPSLPSSAPPRRVG